MVRPTVGEVDKKLAVIEQQLTDHVIACEKVGDETLNRVKRVEYFIIATLFSVISGTVVVVTSLLV